MLTNKLKQISSSQYIRNVGWLGAAELVNRIFRLGTTVTLARMFSSQDYGLMAIIYTVFDFAMVFSLRGGIGAKIIQADREDVQSICDTSYWLNWIMCTAIFIVQCLAAFPIAQFYGNSHIILPLCTAALMYLMFPLFIIQIALIERENRLKITALCNATQSIIGNIITVVLALLGQGIWAIIWSMVLTTTVWVVISWRCHPWRPPQSFKLEGWREITHFGKNLLIIDLLNKVRLNLDYLIVGKFLGLSELGIYYFAFNAGYGITINVVSTFMTALFPYICAVRDDPQQFKQRYLSSLKKITLFIVPIVCLQAFLAQFYVPIVFGQKWVTAVPVLVMICLSVIPRVFGWASFLLLNALDKTHITLYMDIVFTIIFAVSILLVVKGGIFWVAAAVLISHLIIIPTFGLWIYQYVFNRDRIKT